MLIREYNPQTDQKALEVCFSELQEFSRAHDGRILDANSVKGKYLAEMQRQCIEHEGIVFVAEKDAAIVGYVCVLAKGPADEPADGVVDEAQIVDLVVLKAAQGKQIGRSLLRRAEEYVASRGAQWLRVRVFAWNNSALSLYERLGYTPLEITVEKRVPIGAG